MNILCIPLNNNKQLVVIQNINDVSIDINLHLNLNLFRIDYPNIFNDLDNVFYRKIKNKKLDRSYYECDVTYYNNILSGTLQQNAMFAYITNMYNDKRLIIPTILQNVKINLFVFNVKLNVKLTNILIKERKFTTTEPHNDFGIYTLNKIKAYFKLDTFTNIIKMIIPKKFNNLDFIYLPTNYTRLYKHNIIAYNGSKWTNYTHYPIKYYAYGLQFSPKLYNKFLLPKNFNYSLQYKFIIQNNNLWLIINEKIKLFIKL